jgi:hypothetical protein
MKSFLYLITLSTGLFAGALASAQSHMGSSPPMSKAESMQMSQDMTPQARSELARREAHAAYREAMSACKSMGKMERKECSSEAKTNLNKDLNYAKDIRRSGASMGGSGSGTNSTGYGGDRVSGSNDLSGAGSSGGSGMGGGGMGGSGMGGMTGPDSGGNDRSGRLPPDRTMGQPTSGMSNESMKEEKLTAAEKQQFVQSFTPQAQYNLAKREAQAAHAEALKACKPLSRAERTACTKEARASLQQDLAFAKRKLQEDSSGASNGSATDSATSGAGR